MWFILVVFLLPLFLFDLPLKQREDYHAFADRRCLRVPNFADVVSTPFGGRHGTHTEGRITLFSAGVIPQRSGRPTTETHNLSPFLGPTPHDWLLWSVFESLGITQFEAPWPVWLVCFTGTPITISDPTLCFSTARARYRYQNPGFAVALYIAAKMCNSTIDQYIAQQTTSYRDIRHPPAAQHVHISNKKNKEEIRKKKY